MHVNGWYAKNLATQASSFNHRLFTITYMVNNLLSMMQHAHAGIIQ